jgi:hypothetical protein
LTLSFMCCAVHDAYGATFLLPSISNPCHHQVARCDQTSLMVLRFNVNFQVAECQIVDRQNAELSII